MTLPLSVRGKRPRIHDDPAIDRLVAMVLTLAQEVSVTRDRLDSLQRLAEANGWLAGGALESFVPDLPERQRREARRDDMLARIFHVLHEEIDQLQDDATDSDYWATIRAVESGEL